MKSQRPTTRAFTLVELLVVIGIIAVLVGILLPALSGAQNAAKRATATAQSRDIINASSAFRAQEGRAPGFFSETAMGDPDNEAVGFTQMENLLLDLAGGVQDPLADRDNDGSPDGVIAPDPANDYLEVGPYPAGDPRNIIVDTIAIGSTEDGPGYLAVDADQFFPVFGQATVWDEYDAQNQAIVKGMPDVIDPWGAPVVAWRRDPGAPLQAPSSASGSADFSYFAKIDSSLERAGFYWNSNAAIFNSGSPAAINEAATQGLGEERANVFLSSILGGDMVNADDQLVIKTMAAALGSPAFPVEETAVVEWRPAQARGEIIVMSAGPDRMYLRPANLARGQAVTSLTSRDEQWVAYVPTGSGQQGGTTTKDITAFDDVITSGG